MTFLPKSAASSSSLKRKPYRRVYKRKPNNEFMNFSEENEEPDEMDGPCLETHGKMDGLSYTQSAQGT
jgi:hypothetical protein